jgi:hypothetical protein
MKLKNVILPLFNILSIFATQQQNPNLKRSMHLSISPEILWCINPDICWKQRFPKMIEPIIAS